MSIQEKFNDDNKSIPMLLDENKIKQLIAESKDPFSYIYEISELMFDKANRLIERAKLVESKADRLIERVKLVESKVDRLSECVKVAKYKVGRLDKCIKVVESKEISLSDTFVLLKRINCNNDEYMEYYVIYGKKNNVTATMRRKLKYGNMELVFSIDCSPNIKNLYHRVKERLSNKIETYGNSIDLVDITQEEFCREISCINNEYKV